MDPKSWEKAKELSKEFGYLPIPFTTTVRLLISNYFEHGPKLRPVNKFQVARLLRSNSFKSMMYYLTIFVKEKEIVGQKSISNGDMLALFNALDLASVFGLFVLYRKARKIAGEQSWNSIREHALMPSITATVLGEALPNIGFGPFLLSSLTRDLCLAPFAKSNPKSFSQLMRGMPDTPGTFNSDLELELFGCTSSQIGVLVLGTLGFGREFGNAFLTATETPERLDASDKLTYLLKMAKLWINCTLAGKDQPVIRIPGEYYPMAEARKLMTERLAQFKSNPYHWIERESADIGPEATPQLFYVPKDDNNEFEIPNELKDIFSLKDITNMDEEEFDDLIDQIDKEQSGEVKVGGETFSTSDMSKIADL